MDTPEKAEFGSHDLVKLIESLGVRVHWNREYGSGIDGKSGLVFVSESYA